MSVPVVIRGKEGGEVGGVRERLGRMEWVVDLVLLSISLISHVDRYTPSLLEECALDGLLPLEVSSCYNVLPAFNQPHC